MRAPPILGYCSEKNLIQLLKKSDWKKAPRGSIRRFFNIDFAGSYLFEKSPGPLAPKIRVMVFAIPQRGTFTICGYGYTPDVVDKDIMKKIERERDKIMFCGHRLRNLTLQQLSKENDLWPYECIVEITP